LTFACLSQVSSTSKLDLQIIVVGSESEARDLVDRLGKGEDFSALAKQKSIDATSADGGYLGKVDLSTLRLELRDAAVGLAPAGVSGIIKLPSGFAILRRMPVDQSPAQGYVTPSRSLPLAATGAIRYSPNVGGKGEADLAFRNYSKPEGWSQDLEGLCRIRKQSLTSVVDQLSKDLSLQSPDSLSRGSALDQIETHYALANLYAYQGTMDKSVHEWETAYQIAQEQLPGAMAELEEVLGIAYLHKSEIDNDVYRNPGDRCIFPPAVPNRYQKTGDSEKAVSFLSKYLQRKPEALDAKWLLNLAYMTLGQYPDGVPKDFLIQPSAFESPEEVGRFTDVAPAAGIKLFSESGGLIVDDFDGDGLFDIVTSDFDQCAPMHFFHNNEAMELLPIVPSSRAWRINLAD